MLTAYFVIADDHPSLAGHFPGNAITPGVVSLDHIAAHLLAIKPDMYVAGFPQVKFLQPVLPAVEVKVEYKEKSETLYQFTCENEDKQKLISGQIQLQYKGH